MRRDARGMMLLHVLLAASIIAVLGAAALPRARSLYVRAAVEYEAVHLVGELRRIQAVSRTTAMPLYMLGGTAAGAREPQLYVRSGSYEIAPHGGAGHVHRMLPLVRITQVTADGKPMSFDRNGGIGQGEQQHDHPHRGRGARTGCAERHHRQCRTHPSPARRPR